LYNMGTGMAENKEFWGFKKEEEFERRGLSK
jgi:hypothetical protein